MLIFLSRARGAALWAEHAGAAARQSTLRGAARAGRIDQVTELLATGVPPTRASDGLRRRHRHASTRRCSRGRAGAEPEGAAS